jgi:hypothetical protein
LLLCNQCFNRRNISLSAMMWFYFTVTPAEQWNVLWIILWFLPSPDLEPIRIEILKKAELQHNWFCSFTSSILPDLTSSVGRMEFLSLVTSFFTINIISGLMFFIFSAEGVGPFRLFLQR